MIAFIDGDIVAFRCAATAEENEEWVALARTKELTELILQEVGATEYKIFLTGKGNFRKEIWPQYKANREGKPIPKHLNICRDYLVKDWQAEVINGIEADDALGIYQTSYHALFDGCIICSIDKDLLQIPGLHYNWVKKVFSTITIVSAIRNFYTQLLVGDPADNIRGCPGIGKAKAPKILDGCETEQEMFDAVRIAYNNDELMFLNAQLLYIKRSYTDCWSPAKFLKQDRGVVPESMQQIAEESTPFTVLG